MKEHYNLYYLMLEDKKKHPLPKAQSDAIRKTLKNFLERQNLLKTDNPLQVSEQIKRRKQYEKTNRNDPGNHSDP